MLTSLDPHDVTKTMAWGIAVALGESAGQCIMFAWGRFKCGMEHALPAKHFSQIPSHFLPESKLSEECGIYQLGKPTPNQTATPSQLLTLTREQTDFSDL